MITEVTLAGFPTPWLWLGGWIGYAVILTLLIMLAVKLHRRWVEKVGSSRASTEESPFRISGPAVLFGIFGGAAVLLVTLALPSAWDSYERKDALKQAGVDNVDLDGDSFIGSLDGAYVSGTFAHIEGESWYLTVKPSED